MALSKRQRESLARFLRGEQVQFTPSGELAAYLLDYYGDLLSWKGKKLFFTQVSKTAFKNAVLIHEPDILLTPLTDQSRIAFSSVSKFEKSAPVKPDTGMIQLAHHSGKYACIDGSVQLPVGCALRAPDDQIRLKAIQKVVIIENLDIFDQWHEARWEDRCDHTVAAYRGHERSLSQGLNKWLSTLPPSIKVIAFCDYDPEGVKIGLTLPRVDALLLPELDENIIQRYNRVDLWQKQQQAVSFIKKYNEAANIQALSALTTLHKPLAILQQTMLSQKLKLYDVYL